MGRKCIVAGYNTNEFNCGPLGLRMIGVPEKTAQTWLEAIYREDLLAKGPVHVAKNFKICSRHFEKKYFMTENLSKVRNCLKKDAVPCLLPPLEPDLQEESGGEPALPEEMSVLPSEDFSATNKRSQPLVPQSVPETRTIAVQAGGKDYETRTIAVQAGGDVKKSPEDILGAWCSATDHLVLSLLSAESRWEERMDLLRKQLCTRMSSLVRAGNAILSINGGEANIQTFPTAKPVNDSLSERAIVNEKSLVEYVSFAEKENEKELESTVLEELIGKCELFTEERQEDVNLSLSPTRPHEDGPEVLRRSVGEATAAQHDNKSQDLREGRSEETSVNPPIVAIPDCFDSTVMPSKEQPLSPNTLPTGELPVKDRERVRKLKIIKLHIKLRIKTPRNRPKGKCFVSS